MIMGEVPGQGKVMQTGAKLGPAKEDDGAGRKAKRRRNWSTPGQGPVAHKVNGEAVPIVTIQSLKNCRFLYYQMLCALWGRRAFARDATCGDYSFLLP